MNETVRKTKYLTEAAAATAIATMLVLLKLLAPFLVFVTMIAGPLPIIVITAWHGMRWGMGTALAVILLVSMIGGVPLGITTAVYAGALGLSIGYGYLHGWAYGKTWFLATVAYLLEMSYKITVSIYVLGIADALTATIERFTSFIQWIWQPLSRLFAFDPDPGRATFTLSGMVMVGILFVVNGICYAYLNMELSQDILKRLSRGLRR